MKKDNLETYFVKIKNTNRTLASYVDWEKVKKNYNKHKLNLVQLNILTRAKNFNDLKKYIDQIFAANRADVFQSLEILIAKRDEKNIDNYEYFDEESYEILKYDLFKKEGVLTFIKKTNLINLFENVNSLEDYVFGVEVGLDSNGRKNRSGKMMEKFIRNILNSTNIVFKEQVSLSKIKGVDFKLKKTKVIDFVFEKNNYTYLIETSFYNSGGSKISEVCNSYSDFTAKLDKTKFKMIWVADGKGMKTIKNLLNEQWKNVNVMSIEQFREMLLKI